MNKKNLIIRNLIDKRFLNLFLHNGNFAHYVLNYFNTSSWKKISYIFKLEVFNSFKKLLNLKYKKFSIYKKIKFFLKKVFFKKNLINNKRLFKNNIKKQILNKHFYLKFIIFKRINILFLRFSFFLNIHNKLKLLNANNFNNNFNLLTNLVFKANNKISFLQDIKAMFFVLNKKVYFFNNINFLPYCFYDFFNKSCFYFLNYSFDNSRFSVKYTYTKFLKFFFRKFRSRKLFNLRKVWYLNTKKARYIRKARLKFKKFSSFSSMFPTGFIIDRDINKPFRRKGSHFIFKRPRFLRKLDLWGFKRKLCLHKLAKVQLGFYYRSKFLQYSKISRLKHYLYSFGLVYDRLYLLFFLQLIYQFIDNTIRYFKYVTIIDIY